jgi:hypothetical protein
MEARQHLQPRGLGLQGAMRSDGQRPFFPVRLEFCMYTVVPLLAAKATALSFYLLLFPKTTTYPKQLSHAVDCSKEIGCHC